MKLYVLYEQACDDESGHRYFLNKEIAEGELIGEEHCHNEAGLESYWKLVEVETED